MVPRNGLERVVTPSCELQWVVLMCRGVEDWDEVRCCGVRCRGVVPSDGVKWPAVRWRRGVVCVEVA